MTSKPMDVSEDASVPDLLATMWPDGPAPCPAWELVASGRGVKAHSWISPEEAAGTHVIPEQAILDWQSNKKITERKEDSIASLHILPCVVEQSPAIAACAGSSRIFTRYTTSIASILLLNDLRLFFGVVWSNEHKLAHEPERAAAMVEQMRLFRASHAQWEVALTRAIVLEAAASEAVLQQFTLRYIHLLERTVMQMLWIQSKREPDQVLETLPRFLTRAVIYPTTVFGSVGMPALALERHCLDAARFFSQKQSIIFAGCESASESQARSFFPPESTLLQRGGLVAPATLVEYQRYLLSPYAFQNVT